MGFYGLFGLFDLFADVKILKRKHCWWVETFVFISKIGLLKPCAKFFLSIKRDKKRSNMTLNVSISSVEWRFFYKPYLKIISCVASLALVIVLEYFWPARINTYRRKITLSTNMIFITRKDSNAFGNENNKKIFMVIVMI